MNADGWIVLAILAAAIIAFASNRFRLDAVGLAVLLALSVSGIVTVGEALAGFSDPAVLMIAGLFVVGEGLVATGVAARLGAWLADAGKGSERRLIAMLMAMVAFVGAFMSSTGIVAIFIPVVLGVVARTGASRARMMMPLSVAGLISGLMTLIATAPNLVISAALTQRGLEPFEFFELTPIGLGILVVAIVFMVTVGRRLLDRPETIDDKPGVTFDELLKSYGLTGRFRLLEVSASSPLVGRTIGDAQIGSRYGVMLSAVVHRGSGRPVPALAETLLGAGDQVGAAAAAATLDRFAAAERLTEQPINERLRAAARERIGLAEVIVAPDAPLVGKTVVEAAFRRRRGLTVLAIKHRGQVIDDGMLETRLGVGDMMLVAGGWPLIGQLHADPSEFVVLRLPREAATIPPAAAKAPIALSILAGMVVAMTAGLLPNAIAVLLAALAMAACGCVSARAVYHSVGWSTVVLIAGMLPLATGLEKTGVTHEMAVGLTHFLADAGPYAMLAALFAITAAAGLFISNTATAVLLAPVAIGAAQDLGVSVHAFAVTVAIACSCAFVTPVSSPVNTLVLEPGRYSFGDFVKVGLPLLFLSLIVTVAMVGALYPIGS